MKASTKPQKPPISRAQVARVIFRTMKLEEPAATQALAKKAARLVKLTRT